ncbi:MAG: hypothetical protein IKC52_01060 [Clostridia bacterium]|nr:hypothetical protein [Clostridia bacterium]
MKRCKSKNKKCNKKQKILVDTILLHIVVFVNGKKNGEIVGNCRFSLVFFQQGGFVEISLAKRLVEFASMATSAIMADRRGRRSLQFLAQRFAK